MIWGNAPDECNTNATLTYSCVTGWTGTTMVTTSPLLTSGTYLLLTNSPCINTGTNLAWSTNTVDIGGDPRIVNTNIDIGCDEWQLGASTAGGGVPLFASGAWVSTGAGGPVGANELGLGITMYDLSGSTSELYCISFSNSVTNITVQAPDFGVPWSETVVFQKGTSYTVRIEHVATSGGSDCNVGAPDYDYTAWIEGAPASTNGSHSNWVYGAGFAIHDPDGILGTHGSGGCTAAFDALNKTATLYIIDVELKVTHPQNPGPTGSAAKYSNTPTNGCADNLFSTWDNEQFRIDVQIAPSAVTSSLPSGFITWSTPGFTVPDDTTSYTFAWTNAGTKVVTNTCGGEVRMVHVDVPDVGTMTEAVAASRVGLAALFIRSYHTDAETYGGSFTGPESDARRHCYWNALGASSINVGAVNMAMLATGHERNNRLGITSNGAPAVPPGGPNQAYYCTMDLFNNSVGRGIVETTWLGNPDTADIQSQIDTLFSSGNLWIWDGTGMWSAVEGILMKSDGTKIY